MKPVWLLGHAPGQPEQAPGPAGVKAFFSNVRSTFPDIHVTIDDIIAEDAKVVVRTTWHKTRPGQGTDNEAARKQERGTLIQIFYLKNERIVEEWNEGTTA